jgi:flagellin
MNAYRNYNNNTSALSSNLEKLSSGYKINRAGDDAAGLAISEKMRAQISGLEQASSNVKDGISLVKTGEGALQEVQDMLNRMVTLATQSANGTYDDDVDRANLQKEVDQLTAEIDRIADSSNFNGIQLLDGSLQSGATVSGTDATPAVTVNSIRGTEVTEVKPEFEVTLDGVVFEAQTAAAATGATGVSVVVGGTTIALKVSAKVSTGSTLTLSNLSVTSTPVTIAGCKYAVTYDGTKLTFTASTAQTSAITAGMVLTGVSVSLTKGSADFAGSSQYNVAGQVIKSGAVAAPTKQAQGQFDLTTDMVSDGGTLTIGDATFTFTYSTAAINGQTIGVKDLLDSNGDFDSSKLAEAANRITQASNSQQFSIGSTGSKIVYQSLTSNDNDDVDLSTADKVKAQVSATGAGGSGKALTLQIGDTSKSYNQLEVSIDDMHATNLGIDGDSISIASQSGAQAAIDKIKAAINKVSSTRGTLGATQNRLEHTSNNLSVMTENIQDAESTIRDTDIAEEMMSYTKNSILVQSAQAMLAQANTVPQGVLQLLQ